MRKTGSCICHWKLGKILKQAEWLALSCVGYSDADWAGDKDDSKSTSGYLFQVARGPVSWRSKKQDTVALSTAEAKYVALSSAAKECVWIQRLNSDLENPPKGPTTIWKITSHPLQWP